MYYLHNVLRSFFLKVKNELGFFCKQTLFSVPCFISKQDYLQIERRLTCDHGCEETCDHAPAECCRCKGTKCFPAMARVSLENGVMATMVELKRGDRVKTGKIEPQFKTLQP